MYQSQVKGGGKHVPGPKNSSGKPPLVSVSIITYNQCHLIGRALDSVLMQRVTFDYEIIVGDDCSSDGTQEVLLDYQRRFPDRIFLILHPRRYQGEVPGRTNNVTNLCACRGKYTAMLDGDDYWTDPGKLQRQVDYLEGHPEVGAYLHDAVHVFESDHPRWPAGVNVSDWGDVRKTGRYTLSDLVMPHSAFVVQISTIMFRTRLVPYFPDWFYEIVGADIALIWLLAQRADFYYEPTVRSAYWVGTIGMMANYLSTIEYTQRMLKDLEIYRRHFPELERAGYLARQLSLLRVGLLKQQLRRREIGGAAATGLRLILNDPNYFVVRGWGGVKRLVRSLAKSAAIST